jgi:hypothetical protein
LDRFAELIRELHRASVRFVVIGVAGANYHAVTHQTLFATQDRDLFLPPDADNELAAFRACGRLGLQLTADDEPVGEPIDLELAARVVDHRATVRAQDSASGVQVDLNLLMAGFGFEEVWEGRTFFTVEDVSIPVARLEHIVRSRRAAGRDKDLLFLKEHGDVLEHLLRRRPGRQPRT